MEFTEVFFRLIFLMKNHLLLLLFCLTAGKVFSQNINSKTHQIHIKKTETAVKIDGLLDDEAWQSAQMVKDFIRVFPVDSGLSENPTEVRLSFDDQFLYLAGKCFQPRNSYTVQSLKRDFPGGTSDVLNLLLDPTKDGLNGFLFGASPFGVQRECLISNGANLEFDWDNRWFCATQNYDDHWTVEMAVPFKTLRYNVAEGENTWNINFVRTKLKGWEVSDWAPVPRQFVPNNIAFCGRLIWDSPPPKQGLNFSVIPYVRGGYAVDFQRDKQTLEVLNKPHDWSGAAGGDAKIAVTSGLNLDLTINPDFSQVEVDRQVANLSRFELFFPERRQFFLENRDLFAFSGFPETRPFFSRRIGLAFDSLSGGNRTVPILAGARLSGKLTDKLRVGFLNMQTKQQRWGANSVLPAANFTVATLQQRVFQRSALTGILVNKQNFLGKLDNSERGDWKNWNRVAGLEYNLYTPDNRWEGEWYYHRSFSPDKNLDDHSFAQFLGYNTRFWTGRLGGFVIGKNYDSESGFVPRQDFMQFFTGGSRIFYPKKGQINSWNIGPNANFGYNLAGKLTDREASLQLEIESKNQTKYNLNLTNSYVFLRDDFDPTNLYEAGSTPLAKGTDYTFSSVAFSFFSSTTFDWQGSVEGSAGEFFNGNLLSINGNLSYRLQPVGLFSLGLNYNRIRLPKPFPSGDVLLISPRVELSFTKNLFASAFFQFNTQANNFNVNARLQWRFAPVSDLFLVYTDNSFAEAVPNSRVGFFSPKNRALVLKAVYWLAG